MEYRNLTIGKRGQVATLTLNRPDKLNTLSLADLDGLSLDGVENQLEIVALSPPPEKQPGRVLSGEKEQAASELVHLLQSQAKVL